MKALLTVVLMFMSQTLVASDSPPVETHQVIYLSDAQVVTLQMSIRIEGQGPKQWFGTHVDTLLKNLDKNGDGVVTVDEARGKIVTPREAQQMQLAAEDTTSADASPDISPKDGKISRAELLSYFKRIGLSSVTVKFQPRNQQTDSNAGAMPETTGEVPLFAKLDVNDDKKLSVEELQNAFDILRKLDRDHDETISIAELQPLANQPRRPNRAVANNTPSTAIPFISLAGGESMPKLIRRLVDKYDSADETKSGVPSLSKRNQKLSRMELGLPDAKFNRFDVDGDGQLDFAELRQFVTSPEPDVELGLDITSGKVTVPENSGPTVRLTSDGSANLSYGTAQINVSVLPTSAEIDPETMIKPFFQAIDRDANGYLEKNEADGIALPGVTFNDMDVDNNGKLYLDEIIDYLKPRMELARHRVEILVVEQGRTLFDILDSDRDRRLAHREVRNVAAKLSLWDSDLDGLLSESEIPLQFQVIATMGTLPVFGMSQPTDLGNPPNASSALANGPSWFTKMDRNRDGEVSRREFLGELDLFDSLDLNHDGAIEFSEALQTRAN